MIFTVIKHKRFDGISMIDITNPSDMKAFKDMYPNHEVVFNADDKVIDIYGYDNGETK